MLFTQTLEKLRALRLEGMVQALEEQRQQNDIVSLSFEDRLALLVERQWLWKENRGLAIRLRNAQFKISASLEDLDYRSSRGLKRAQIVSGQSKPARDGRMKTSHFESGIAQRAAVAALMREERTQCEPAIFNRNAGGQRLVGPEDRARTGRRS
jgi:hypothetical protein